MIPPPYLIVQDTLSPNATLPTGVHNQATFLQGGGHKKSLYNKPLDLKWEFNINNKILKNIIHLMVIIRTMGWMIGLNKGGYVEEDEEVEEEEKMEVGI